MKCAARRCSPKYGFKQWSPRLAEAGRAVRDARKNLLSLDWSDHEYDKATERYEKKKNEWSKIQNRHIDLRREHLENLALTYAERNRSEKKSAIKHVINSERTKSLHDKHKLIFKEPRQQLHSILIPEREDDKWREITEEDEVHQHLLQITKKKLKSSLKRSPFMKNPLLNEIGLYADGPLVDKIVNRDDVRITN